MNNLLAVLLTCLLACALIRSFCHGCGGGLPAAPRVFLVDPLRLAVTAAKARAGDASLAPALEALRRKADSLMDDGPFSVMDKQQTPPSGDKHDYMSVAPYFWPNPDTPDGLPFVRRDGRVNPDRQSVGDAAARGRLESAVITLARAYFFTSDQRYAKRAAWLLRTWFMDPATRMNPSLNYAQAVPGVSGGRGFGLVDLQRWPELIDAIGMLAGSDAWTEADQKALQQWFEMFLDWCRTHPYGRQESKTRNNHATQFHAQLASYALFLNKPDLARSFLTPRFQEMIASQILPDGRQPEELARTNSLSYSIANIRNLMRMAALGQRVGLDLWHYRGPQGQSLQTALDYVLPYLEALDTWPHQQIDDKGPGNVGAMLRQAAAAYGDPRYDQVLGMTIPQWPQDPLSLLYPLEESADAPP